MEQATDKQKKFMDNLGISYPGDISKAEAKTLIDEKVNKSAPKDLKSPKRAPESSYYVAYAKDIVVAMIAAIGKPDMNIPALMKTAIEAIKSAQEAFKQ